VPPLGVVAPGDFHPLFRELLAAGVSRSATVQSFRILTRVIDALPKVDGSVYRTEDDGLTLDLSSEDIGRELTFVVPDDASVRYFVARGRGGFRAAGVVVDDAAFGRMARWMGDQSSSFPSRGLEVG
jgi:hypothetical protein